MSGALGLWAALQEDHLRAPPIKKSDALFAKEDLEFVWGMEGINLDELNDLFELVHALVSQANALMQTSARMALLTGL